MNSNYSCYLTIAHNYRRTIEHSGLTIHDNNDYYEDDAHKQLIPFYYKHAEERV